ncbi:T9SS type A sorting domain-containing protein [Flammeovirga sp. MY04]|uniref:T9SS type A sorting domain-containing protein n=1 Tax=Flammeovirga sp. MY04 TaxID=1191459 RepID=UPI0008060FA6|nr:T9SS type A sorting domain-containing protein [Flammeovirga sp. MY04]ANQ51569.1 T9SS type A sorting domain-containing protein [Flammeovirga sp. MY04]
MKRFFLLFISLIPAHLFAQNIIDVNIDVKHSIEGLSEFDRDKYVTIHAGMREGDWDNAASDPTDIRNDLLNNKNVFLGRDTGHISWILRGVAKQDPNRPGFADTTFLAQEAVSYRNKYSTYSNYAHKNKSWVLGAQLHPFWPDGQKTNLGWALSQTDTEEEPLGTATGEYIAHYIKEFYKDQNEEETPKYFEVINEPVWHLVDYGSTDIKKIFEFHNTVAREIRKVNGDKVEIGGYTTAFPNFEEQNFKRWEDRWNTFMDMCGEEMDFWSIHIYDFASINGGKEMLRKGSNLEATMDMMEHASWNKFDEVKPVMISEYGGQAHDFFKQPWTPERDWYLMRSMSSQTMTFLDRPQAINKVIPFWVLKAEWGRDSEGYPYLHRLLRQNDELEGSTGKHWVYGEVIKYYDLWKDVQGTRVDHLSNNLDIQTDAYLDGNVLYLIINNLNQNDEIIRPNIIGSDTNPITSVEVRHLFAIDDIPQITNNVFNEVPESFSLGSEGTLILAYTFQNEVTIDQSSTESKYFATTYYQEITGGTPLEFSIPNVTVEEEGEAVLRIGIGRDHGKSLFPKIKVNGTEVDVPNNYRGDDQKDKDRFFGVLEVPVPYELIESSNNVSVEFSDASGHISSVSLRVYNFSRPIERSFDGIDPPTGIHPDEVSLIKLFPNPTSGKEVNVVTPKAATSIRVFDIIGNNVFEINQPESEFKIPSNVLKRGMHLVQFNFDGVVVTKKLLVN